MTTFFDLWNNEVKPLAEACVQDPKLIRLMWKDKSYEQSDEEKEYLRKMSPKYKDLLGMYYISEMISQVENALADRRLSVAGLAIARIYQVLDRPSYFQDFFEGNEDDEEWKKRVALRDGLRKLLDTL